MASPVSLDKSMTQALSKESSCATVDGADVRSWEESFSSAVTLKTCGENDARSLVSNGSATLSREAKSMARKVSIQNFRPALVSSLANISFCHSTRSAYCIRSSLRVWPE